jgi:hypothetical protein
MIRGGPVGGSLGEVVGEVEIPLWTLRLALMVAGVGAAAMVLDIHRAQHQGVAGR